MNKIILLTIFFIMFVILEALVYYIYKNKQIISKSLIESYQGSDVNYESCIKGGYPQKWCLNIQDPYSIQEPDSTLDKCTNNADNTKMKRK
jgi:hypothetical protein